MTPQEWIAMVRKIPQMIRDQRVLFFATTATMATMQDRIWGRGELSDGSKLAYKQDYELWAYKPPSPVKPTGKGKPFVDWIVRPESIAERKAALQKSIKRNEEIFQRTGSEHAEKRVLIASMKLAAFKSRFGKDSRKIKGGYYPSYLAYKEQQGREDKPFELSGKLRQAWVGGPTPTPTEKDPLLCVIELPDLQAKIAKGLTETKGAFLAPSKAEEEEHLRNLRDAYQELVLDRL